MTQQEEKTLAFWFILAHLRFQVIFSDRNVSIDGVGKCQIWTIWKDVILDFKLLRNVPTFFYERLEKHLRKILWIHKQYFRKKEVKNLLAI